MSELNSWVSDKLHELVGISDRSIAEFLVGLAGKSSDPSQFIEKIRDTETIDVDDRVSVFATELWGKMPRQQSAGEKRREENRRREREAVDLYSRQSKLGLVDMEDEGELAIKPKKKKKRKKEASKDDSDEDEFERMEKERQKDLEERDAFHQRMVKKDKDKQRNIVTKSDKKGYEEAAKRLKQEQEDKEAMVPELRKQSRRDYLVKRKEDKMQELELDIMDDEFLFDESQLTTREKQEKDYRKKILELAKEHDKARQVEKVARYAMPDERSKGEDMYVEVDETEKAAGYEQRKWEEEHLSQAQFQFGAKDAKRRHKEKEKQYDYILDDEIEFVAALKMPGSKKVAEEEEVTEYEKKRMTMKEVKESLPVFPFRDDFIEAVREHQVI